MQSLDDSPRKGDTARWQHSKTQLSNRQRDTVVEQVAGDAVRFQFTDLCKAVMGSADYQAIAQRFSTVFLTDVPALSIQARSSLYQTALSLVRWCHQTLV